MDRMKVHPAAEIFPMIKGKEFDDFVEDIKLNGLREPIVIDQDGQLLDGRNRLAACKQLGIACETRTVSTDNPVGLILSFNLHRRHLTASQLALVGARIASLPVGVNARYVAARSRDRSATESDEPIALYTTEEIADRLKIGTATLTRGRRVLNEGTPEEIEAIEQGESTVVTVIKEIKQRAGEEPKEPRIIREKVIPIRSTKKELELKLSKQSKVIRSIGEELQRVTSLFAEIEIESEHTVEDIEAWLDSLSISRQRITKFINRLKGVKE
jgi:hypothetical protein